MTTVMLKAPVGCKPMSDLPCMTGDSELLVLLRKLESEVKISGEPVVNLEWDVIENNTEGLNRVQRITRKMATINYNSYAIASTCAGLNGVFNEGTGASVNITDNAWDSAARLIKTRLEAIAAVKYSDAATDYGFISCSGVKTKLNDYGYYSYGDDDTWGITYKYYGDTCTNTGWNVQWYDSPYQAPKPIDPKIRLQQIIDSRQSPRIIIPNHRTPPPMTTEVRELRARETLRRVVGNDRYKNYMRVGFVSVRGKDGKYYQLYPAHGITHVFEAGQLVAKLCLYFPGDFTQPTV